MSRPSYVVTLGLWVCKTTMKASPELVRFSMWSHFCPQNHYDKIRVFNRRDPGGLSIRKPVTTTLQYVSISNQHTVHLTYTQRYAKYTSVKLKNMIFKNYSSMLKNEEAGVFLFCLPTSGRACFSPKRHPGRQMSLWLLLSPRHSVLGAGVMHRAWSGDGLSQLALGESYELTAGSGKNK